MQGEKDQPLRKGGSFLLAAANMGYT